MTERKWFAGKKQLWRHLWTMIHHLEKQPSNERRLRLFCCACFRRVWDLLKLDAARTVVCVAEAYADRGVDESEFKAACNHPDFTRLDAHLRGEGVSGIELTQCVVGAIRATCELPKLSAGLMWTFQETSRDVSRDFVVDSRWYFGGEEHSTPTDERALVQMRSFLRDIFGNPFRPVAFDPALRTADTTGIASKMYDDRDFAAMPILADALEEAGCDNTDILTHCREPGVHVRGCWVVDLVLGKA